MTDAPERPGNYALRAAAFPGWSCHSCAAMIVVSEDWALCGHRLQRRLRLGHPLADAGLKTCDLYRFGRGSGSGISVGPAETVAHRVFLAARERLYEAIVDTNVAGADRARMVEWISRPIPEAP
jgi:hypothetical protein